MIYKKGSKGKLDAIFSAYIRQRDKWICRRCHKPQPYKSKGYHCCHIQGRRKESVRWSEENAVGCCYGCHSFLDNNPIEKTEWFIKEFGQKAWDELKVQSNKIGNLKEWQIQELINKYTLKLNSLKET